MIKEGHIFFDRVTILGVGLIGASFALAMKKHAFCNPAMLLDNTVESAMRNAGMKRE